MQRTDIVLAKHVRGLWSIFSYAAWNGVWRATYFLPISTSVNARITPWCYIWKVAYYLYRHVVKLQRRWSYAIRPSHSQRNRLYASPFCNWCYLCLFLPAPSPPVPFSHAKCNPRARIIFFYQIQRDSFIISTIKLHCTPAASPREFSHVDFNTILSSSLRGIKLLIQSLQFFFFTIIFFSSIF